MARIPTHLIVMLDRETKTGVCAACGSVEVRIRWARGRGELVECRTHIRRIQSSGASNWGTRDNYRDTPKLRPNSRGKAKHSSHELTRAEARARIAAAPCAICQRPAAVNDHCHATGTLRGVLCRPCNLVLGLIGDDVSLLRGAAEYIERYRTAG